MSEQETVVQETPNYLTKDCFFVQYVGNMESVVQNGEVTGEVYTFARNQWVRVQDEDMAKYHRKDGKGNFVVKTEQVPMLRQAHKVKFNGNQQYPTRIDLKFEIDKPTPREDGTTEILKEQVEIGFKVDSWVEISNEQIAKQMASKALHSEHWTYVLDNVPMEAPEVAQPEE